MGTGGPRVGDDEGDAPVQDQFDISLEDDELLGEVELTANLIVAASEADGPLPQEEIDRILGVSPRPNSPHPPEPPATEA